MSTNHVENLFITLATGAGARSCLELGTYEWEPGKSTSVARQWFPDLLDHVRTDITAGPGVDQAADAHNLTAVFGDDRFQLVISRSVHEHLARPWIATQSMADMLHEGGLLYIDTHQTFPLHGYPDDYFRFSADALGVLLADAELEVVATGYSWPCTITPAERVDPWNLAAPSYLHVSAIGRKS